MTQTDKVVAAILTVGRLSAKGNYLLQDFVDQYHMTLKLLEKAQLENPQRPKRAKKSPTGENENPAGPVPDS